VLILASTASFQPVLISRPCGTKAFDRSSRWDWLPGGPLGVKVTALCPGHRERVLDVAHAGAFKRRGMHRLRTWRGWRLRPWRAVGGTLIPT